MRKRRWIVVAALVACLFVAAFAVIMHGLPDSLWPASAGRSPSAPETRPLTGPEELIGEWDRVEFPDAVIPVNWRTFSWGGKFEARYGDLIHVGTYRLIDPTTLETNDGEDGKANRWTVGRAGEKLVLTHQEYGWVEKYVKVAPGQLER
jgi:hypothetical protein